MTSDSKRAQAGLGPGARLEIELTPYPHKLDPPGIFHAKTHQSRRDEKPLGG